METGHTIDGIRLSGVQSKAMDRMVSGLTRGGHMSEEQAMAAAKRAFLKKYVLRDGVFGLKESDEAAAMEMWADAVVELYGGEPSLDEMNSKLERALGAKYPPRKQDGTLAEAPLGRWPVEVYPSYVIWRNDNGGHMAESYSIKEDGEIELAGDAKEVKRAWVPVEEETQEVIRKRGDKWVLFTSDGKKVLGEFDSEAAAQKRERQIQFFKHAKEAWEAVSAELLRRAS